MIRWQICGQTLGNSRTANEERDVRVFLVRKRLSTRHAVLSQVISVVGTIDNDCILELTFLLEYIDQMVYHSSTLCNVWARARAVSSTRWMVMSFINGSCPTHEGLL